MHPYVRTVLQAIVTINLSLALTMSKCLRRAARVGRIQGVKGRIPAILSRNGRAVIISGKYTD